MAIAAITLIMPIMMVFLAIATMIGIGSASIISRALGAGDQKKAISTMANAYLLNLTIVIPLIAIVYIFKDKILSLFGANEIVFRYASDYLSNKPVIYSTLDPSFLFLWELMAFLRPGP